MTRQIENEVVVVDVPGIGRVAYMLPVVPEDAPPLAREGLTRRRLAALTGRCPCGTIGEPLSRQQRRAQERARAKGSTDVLHARFEHEADCPAVDDNLVPILRAWAGGTEQGRP